LYKKKEVKMLLASLTAIVEYDQRRSSYSSLNKKSMTLPRIEHPSKRLNDNERNSLDIRGRSRDGEGELIRSESSTPQSPRRH
jgi:hypothetical protein